MNQLPQISLIAIRQAYSHLTQQNIPTKNFLGIWTAAQQCPIQNPTVSDYSRIITFVQQTQTDLGGLRSGDVPAQDEGAVFIRDLQNYPQNAKELIARIKTAAKAHFNNPHIENVLQEGGSPSHLSGMQAEQVADHAPIPKDPLPLFNGLVELYAIAMKFPQVESLLKNDYELIPKIAANLAKILQFFSREKKEGEALFAIKTLSQLVKTNEHILKSLQLPQLDVLIGLLKFSDNKEYRGKLLNELKHQVETQHNIYKQNHNLPQLGLIEYMSNAAGELVHSSPYFAQLSQKANTEILRKIVAAFKIQEDQGQASLLAGFSLPDRRYLSTQRTGDGIRLAEELNIQAINPERAASLDHLPLEVQERLIAYREEMRRKYLKEGELISYILLITGSSIKEVLIQDSWTKLRETAGMMIEHSINEHRKKEGILFDVEPRLRKWLEKGFAKQFILECLPRKVVSVDLYRELLIEFGFFNEVHFESTGNLLESIIDDEIKVAVQRILPELQASDNSLQISKMGDPEESKDQK